MTGEPRGILSPKNDFVFKQLFGDARNVDTLAAFLQAALDLPEEEFEDVRIVDPHLNAGHGGDKHSILDVRVKTSSGRDVDVEIQLKPASDLLNRLHCYTAKMVAEQAKRGENYGSMAQSITIAILDFRQWSRSSRYHHRFRLYDPDAGFEYPNSMEIHTLELPKLPRKSDGTSLWNWLRFLSSETREEVEFLAGKDSAMAKACGRLMELSADEAARLRADAHDKWEWDNRSRMRDSREEGLATGRKEGRREVALQMLELQLPVDLIMKATKLSKAEIKKLPKKQET